MNKKLLLIGFISLGLSIVLAVSGVALYMSTRDQYNGNITRETKKVPLESFTKLHFDAAGSLSVEKSDVNELTIEGPQKFMSRISSSISGDTLSIVHDKSMSIQIFTLVSQNDIHYTLKVKDLDAVELYGAGDAVFNGGFVQDSFSLKASGMGDITLPEITASSVRIEHAGSGSISGKNLNVRALTIETSGAGDVQLNSISCDSVTYSSTGAGDVTLSGTTSSITLQKSGMGDFNSKDLAADKAVLTLTGAGDTTISVNKELELSKSGVGDVTYYGSPVIKNDISGIGNVKQGK